MNVDESGSLASKMFGTLAGGLKEVVRTVNPEFGMEQNDGQGAQSSGVDSGNAVAASLDARAQSGDINFNDFLTLSSAFAGLGDQYSDNPLLGKLTAAQVREAETKFKKHETIVNAMDEDEREDISLLLEDMEQAGRSAGPRTSRIAKKAGMPDKEVVMFVAEFEAMRQSTARIAAGEDPDEVNDSMGAPLGANPNRAARRAAKLAAKKPK